MKRAAPTIEPVVVPPKKPSLEKVQSVLSFDNQNVPEQKQTDVSLHSKIDSLIGEFKELKLQLGSKTKVKETGQHPLATVDAKCLAETTELLLHWPEVKNIVDLVQLCKHVNFFSGNAEEGILSVVRCETCFFYLKNAKKNSASQLTTQWLLQEKDLVGKLMLIYTSFQ